MNPRILAAIATVFSVILKTHLTVTAAGLTVSISLPWLILAALVLAIAVLTWMIWRRTRGFRSSPYLRTVSPGA